MKYLFISLLFCFSSLFSQTTIDGLDSLFNILEKTNQLNCNVLVAEKGKVAYKKSFGYADFENKIKLNENSEFTIASITKIFTSTATLQLKEKGKLKLDDYFVKYFPEFPYPNITIRNLLTHTSSLPDYQLYEELISKDTNRIIYNKDIITLLQSWKKTLDNKPGEKWEYSNTNYNLLALLIAKISGLSFTRYVNQNIFAIADMKDSYFTSDTVRIKNENRTFNYDYQYYFSSRKRVDSIIWFKFNNYNLSGLQGSGDIISTTNDLLKFDNALYAGKILKRATLAEAFTPTILNNGKNQIDFSLGSEDVMYGLGWFIYRDSTRGKIVGHAGGVAGSRTIFLRNITKNQTAILFDNIDSKGGYRTGINIMNVLNAKPIGFRKKALVQDYGITLVEKGVDAAFCKLIELKSDTLHYVISEEDINTLGGQLFYYYKGSNHKELALEVFKLNVLLYPNSYNTYDSYGEILREYGKFEEAISMYKKSLTLNPESESGKKALKELN